MQQFQPPAPPPPPPPLSGSDETANNKPTTPLPATTKVLIGCGVLFILLLILITALYQLAMRFLDKQIISEILRSEVSTSSVSSVSSTVSSSP